jgi:hypothetical protein
MNAIASSAFSANLPANKCEIFIRRIQALPSSHGMASLAVYVKVNWLGNDEFIQSVGFYATNSDTDLGNSTSCSWSPRPKGTWYTQNPITYAGSGSSATEYGEYRFNFQIYSGSVSGDCGGFSYGTIGSFFVETNKNTYWLNPDLDATKHFYFDANGYDLITKKGGYFNNIFTDRNDMKYYNPLNCKH